MFSRTLKYLLLASSLTCFGLTGCGGDKDKGKNEDLDRPSRIEKK